MQIIKSFPQIIITILLFNFFGCDKDSDIYNNDDSIVGSGKIVTQLREVGECSGITIKNVGNIYLTWGDEQSVRVEADDNIIDDVITVNENGNLIVGLEDGSYSDITLKIYISLKTIKNLAINGAGNIVSENLLNCDSLNLVINGAGDINIEGNSNYLNCFINGAGKIMAKDLITIKCKALVNGAGNLTIYVTEELDASVNGAGTIFYYGNPANVKTSITGFGQIIKK